MSDKSLDRRSYLIGAVLSVVLTLVAFATVLMGQKHGPALSIIAIAALAQTIVQLRFFLHIDLSRQKREDLHLILFSLVLLLIISGGTVWILTNLSHRMM